MMNRAEQNWPEDETVEIPTDETQTDQHNGRLINDLINVVEQIGKGTNEKNQNGN